MHRRHQYKRVGIPGCGNVPHFQLLHSKGHCWQPQPADEKRLHLRELFELNISSFWMVAVLLIPCRPLPLQRTLSSRKQHPVYFQSSKGPNYTECLVWWCSCPSRIVTFISESPISKNCLGVMFACVWYPSTLMSCQKTHEKELPSYMMPYHLLPDVVHHPCHVGGPRGLASQNGDHVATLNWPGNNINFQRSQHLSLIENSQSFMTATVIIKNALTQSFLWGGRGLTPRWVHGCPWCHSAQS